MKGTLIKNGDKWEIINVQATLNGPLFQSLPLHPNQVWWLNEHKGKPGMYKGGEEVKFELVDDWDLPADKDNMRIKQYAKIVN